MLFRSAMRSLGFSDRADELVQQFAEWIEVFAVTPARVDYFATSLPTMLLFHDDPQEVRNREVIELRECLSALKVSTRESVAPAAID